MRFSENKGIYLLLLLFGVIIGGAFIALLFVFNWSIIIVSYQSEEGSLGVLLIIGIRILIVSLMTIYTFYKWFKQEKQYFSDIPFLFGSFFLLLTFGKFIDLFGDFVFYQNEELSFMVLKSRYFIAILTLLPMMYLSIQMILFSFSLKKRFQKLTEEKYLNKTNIRILILIIIFEIIPGIIITNRMPFAYLYPIIVIPSLITIAWLFNFAWRNQRLSQVNTFILMIGFGIYLISSIIRPLIQFIVGNSSLFLIMAESIDLIIFLIIFIGFSKKSNYMIIEKSPSLETYT